MFNKTMYTQMVNFQKTTFENSFNAMLKMQEQGEAMLNVFLSQATWMPEEGKKAIKDWAEASQKARADFKKVVDDNFKIVEKFADSYSESNK